MKNMGEEVSRYPSMAEEEEEDGRLFASFWLMASCFPMLFPFLHC